PAAPVSFFGAAASSPPQPSARAVAKPAQLPAQSPPARAEVQAQVREAPPSQTPAPAVAQAAATGEMAKANERSPQAWIEDIRKLMSAGKSEEAGEEIAKFKKRYPDYALPEDLR
ncbi:MAG TPA: hypothetical protein VJO54_07875, partial [Burkholderiales bacterium]|nr:hypothetical protein [Burkholderiales bacterium]